MPIPLIALPEPAVNLHARLPSGDDNLFMRIIRDPTAPDRPVRERLCTEMLCALLRNTTTLRDEIFRWLADLSGCPQTLIKDLDWQIETEQAIGSKRDDLRIEGWRLGEDDTEEIVLWTIEVKVAAPLHESGALEFDEDQAVAENTEDVAGEVNQLLNYDAWLARQPAPRRAGWVLAISDLSPALPVGLTQPWHCVTWTQFGRHLDRLLGTTELPVSDRFLARHALGFIRRYLWSEKDMGDSNLELEDVALLRAFTEIGLDCEKKINRLVAGLEEIVNREAVFRGSVRHQTVLFKSSGRSMVYAGFLPDSVCDQRGCVYIMAGVSGGDAAVWIESSPAKAMKGRIRQSVHQVADALRERNPDWGVFNAEDRVWPDLELRMSMVQILAADDQQEALTSFVASAVEDLKAVGLLDMIENELNTLGDSV